MTLAFGINTVGMNLSVPRLAIPAESRNVLIATGSAQFVDVTLQRTAQTVYGYHRPNPFLRDLLTGAQQRIPDSDWWGYVHADIILGRDFCEWVGALEEKGHRLLTANRLNIPECHTLEETHELTFNDVQSIAQNQGVELMLVHRSVYNDFMSKLPDIVVGIDGWGRVVRAIGRDFHLHHCNSHEQTPLRHMVHSDHPGKRRSVVRQLNSLMFRAVKKRG